MQNLNREFIPYEESLALKELGFNEPCLFAYNQDDNNKLITAPQLSSYQINTGKNSDKGKFNKVTTPTYSQAFRWFREKYQLHSGIYPFYDQYEFQIKDFRSFKNTPINGGLMRYEEAELACLQKLIEIVKITKG